MANFFNGLMVNNNNTVQKPAGPVEGEVEEEKAAVNDETDMLDSLTG